MWLPAASVNLISLRCHKFASTLEGGEMALCRICQLNQGFRVSPSVVHRKLFALSKLQYPLAKHVHYTTTLNLPPPGLEWNLRPEFPESSLLF